MTNQQLQKLKNVIDGNCQDCGTKRNLYAHRCDECQEVHREYMRNRYRKSKGMSVEAPLDKRGRKRLSKKLK